MVVDSTSITTRDNISPIQTMRALVACDSFKDALPAEQVCRAIATGLKKTQRAIVVEEMPLSDGGEGLLRAVGSRLQIQTVSRQVCDPLFRKIDATLGFSPDRQMAVLELAEASGLERLSQTERNPLLTSTYGTGELLAFAKAQGARKILMGIGGSATNDAGIGAAAALGWRFLDKDGTPLSPIGGELLNIVTIVPPNAELFESMDVLCDVDNPLYGPGGAAFVYGRQKGGDDQSLAVLDAGLRHVAGLVEAQLGHVGYDAVPGAGAAGGFGFGAMSFLGARLRSGIDMVLDLTGFDQAAARADIIITGEGRLDSQSARGKLIQGICTRAGATPVIALCGDLAIGEDQVRALGLSRAVNINPVKRPLPQMLAATAQNLEIAAASLLR